MRLAFAVAAWALVSTFPQGKLYRHEREDSEVVALRAEGQLKAPAWAVRDVLVRAYESDRISPYLAERKVLHAEGCRDGGKDLPSCRKVWAYERYEPPLMSPRDYAFRMEVSDGIEDGGDFADPLAARRPPRQASGGSGPHGPQHRVLGGLPGG